MALDRFITWQVKRPSKKTIEKHLTEFLGTGFDLRWEEDRWFISIPGKPSPRVNDCLSPFNEERFIEVFPSKVLDIMTRRGEPLVNAIADGLARFLCLRLKGTENTLGNIT